MILSCTLFLKCADYLALPLSKFFQACVSQGRCPNTQTTAVHKEKSWSNVGNYWPESLVSYIGKIMETLIADQIMGFLNKHSILNERQFGFRKGHSTADLLLTQSLTWNQGLEDHLFICVSIWCFSSIWLIWHLGLLEKMQVSGIGGQNPKPPQQLPYWATSTHASYWHNFSWIPYRCWHSPRSVCVPLL